MLLYHVFRIDNIYGTKNTNDLFFKIAYAILFKHYSLV